MEGVTNYAEIAAGFIKSFGFVGPLLSFAAPDMKLTLMIKLRNPDKKIFIDLSHQPLEIVEDGPQESADVMFSTDAELFHYILWGKLSFSKAINESVALLVIRSGALPDMPIIETPEERRTGTNPLYEAYLINIGAGHLLEEKVNLAPIPTMHIERSIYLKPRLNSGLLQKTFIALSFVIGYVGGLGLRIYMKFRKPPKFEPPEVRYLSFNEVFTPLPPIPQEPHSRTVLKIMNAIFSRVDIMKIVEASVRGAESAGAFKKPIELMPPLSKIMMEQLKQASQQS